jgi:hypothetical protein
MVGRIWTFFFFFYEMNLDVLKRNLMRCARTSADIDDVGAEPDSAHDRERDVER